MSYSIRYCSIFNEKEEKRKIKVRYNKKIRLNSRFFIFEWFPGAQDVWKPDDSLRVRLLPSQTKDLPCFVNQPLVYMPRWNRCHELKHEFIELFFARVPWHANLRYNHSRTCCMLDLQHKCGVV